MIYTDVPCGRTKCFANKCNFCQALWQRPRPDLMDCPFYRDRDEYIREVTILRARLKPYEVASALGGEA